MRRENGNPHGMAYDPTNNVIYEVNHPKDGQGNEVHGFLNWLDGLANFNTAGIQFDNTKSVVYTWNMNIKRDFEAFWSRESGNNYLLAPVSVNDPAAARAWFAAGQGTAWPYNFFTNNCGDYSCQGMNAGGAGISTWYWARPSKFPGDFAMIWRHNTSGPVKIGN